MPLQVKPVIDGASLTVFATDAVGCVSYYVDLEGEGPTDPNIMQSARAQCPQIGQQKDFGGIPGAPLKGNNATQFQTDVHDMRVSHHVVRIDNTKNSKKLFVDVYYRSRPRPTIELGSSAIQQKTNTYVALSQSGQLTYKQMVINWNAPVGIYTQGTKNAQPFPSVEIPFLNTPVQGTRFQFGSTIRLSSTWYNDEITVFDINNLAYTYGTATNRNNFFRSNPPDSTLWLCTSISSVSNDNGYSNRISGEFVYSPFGWDTIGVYTDPQTHQPAILREQDLVDVYTPIGKFNKNVPEAFVTNGSGCGRFPQQLAQNMNPLIGFLSRGLFGGQGIPTLQQVLNPQ